MTGKYKTVVIDPPWKIQPYNFKKGGYAKELPYKTMTDHEITQFPIDDYAAPESMLFLWTTQSKLRTAIQIMLAWKFKQKVVMTWYKTTGPAGTGWHYNTELVVFGYRGKNQLSRHSPISTHIAERARQHSRKPDRFYEILAKCTPGPRIDIFARTGHFGFDTYGDEVQPTAQRYLD